MLGEKHQFWCSHDPGEMYQFRINMIRDDDEMWSFLGAKHIKKSKVSLDAHMT